MQKWRRRGDGQALPRPRGGAGGTPTSPSSGSACRSASCAGSTSCPTGASSPPEGAMVMLSTAIYPAYSPKPAAFARPLATRELRVRLGFRGVSISDALGTVSAGAFGGPAKAGLAAAKAGTDLLLFTDYRTRGPGPTGRCVASCAPAISTGAGSSARCSASSSFGTATAATSTERRRDGRPTAPLLGRPGEREAPRRRGRCRRRGPGRGRRPWPRTSPDRPRRSPSARRAAGLRRTARRRCSRSPRRRSPASVPSRIALVSDSATSRASRRPVSGRRIANSSPPSRASESDSRRRSSRISAICFSTLSPARCPSESFTDLKWSTSISSSAPGVELAA